jgi:protein TonB
MFETVAPDAFEKRSRFVFYESLPVSVGVHAAVIGTVMLATLAHVGFPSQPPRLSVSYSLAQELEPPPPAPPPPAQSQTVVPVSEIVFTNGDVAPTIIPDALPTAPPTHINTFTTDLHPLVPRAVEIGVPGGVAGGDDSGIAGGVIAPPGPRAVMGGLLMDDGRVHFARNAALPMYMEHQAKPEYPEAGRLANLQDDVLVRYIIGKDGRVKEIVVLDHADHKMFDESTLAAIREWRFRPLMVDNQPREVVHELIVHFRLQ